MLQESEIRIDQNSIVFIMKSLKEIYLLNPCIPVLESQGFVEHSLRITVIECYCLYTSISVLNIYILEHLLRKMPL
jgi:hypothetical protein